MYPKYLIVKGEKLPIRTDWKNALKCFDIVQNDEISDTERTYAILYRIYGFVPKGDITEYLEKAQLFLQCGETKEQQNAKPADMDFNYDRKYINASFMSDYHIDLEQCPNMHFWQFVELIQGLTDKSVLSRVRHIRNAKLSDYSPKDRETIKQLKADFALPVKRTKEEREKDDFFEAQMRGEV